MENTRSLYDQRRKDLAIKMNFETIDEKCEPAITPFSPPSGPATGSSNSLHRESNFLAVMGHWSWVMGEEEDALASYP
jgi:hypothetical protein